MPAINPDEDDLQECPEMFDLVWPPNIEPDDDDKVDEYGYPLKLGDFYAS